MITEDYVSFETAKLLKEKGFSVKCSTYYIHGGINSRGETTTNFHNNGETFAINFNDYINELYSYLDYYSAPTLQMAMKWLREVHKLYVEIVPNPFNFEHQDIQDGWGCEVTHLSDLSYDGNYEFFQKKYSTYEEACEAAIKYCLENLI